MKKLFSILALMAFWAFPNLNAQAPVQVKDVLHDYQFSSYVPYIEIGNKIFYQINYGELWVTDGTTSGTLLLKNFASDRIGTFHELNGKLLFFGDENNNGSYELWTSDGTVSGTVQVKNVLHDYQFSPSVAYIKIGSKYFYQINYGELWVTDGSTAGTLMLRNFGSDYMSTFHELNGKLLLFADDNNNNSYELWTSDGSVSGTVQVKNVLHDYTFQPYVPHTKIGSKYFYQINYGELWVTDGSTAGTLLLKNFASDYMSTFHELNGKLLFFGDDNNNNSYELWTSDGSVAGTVQVKNVLHDYSFQTLVPYIKIGSKYFYQVNYGELWVTDGSTNGTLLLKNFASDYMSTFHELNGKLLFFGDDNSNNSYELWTSDGSVAGTVQVKNVLHDYSFQTIVPYAKVGSKYYYQVNYGELWITDGTTAGTLLLKNFSSDQMSTFHVLDGQFLFVADGDGNSTSELWTSDGSVAGTVMVKNLLHNYSNYPHIPYLLGGNRAFYDVNYGELWVSDGTAAGTIMLKNFTSDWMDQFHTLGTDMLFFGDDNNNGRYELWAVRNGVVSTLDAAPARVQLEAWPVPAQGHLNVRMDNADFEDATLSLVDVQGRVLLSTLLDGGSAQLNLAGIAPGLYVLQAQNAEGTRLNRKVVVE